VIISANNANRPRARSTNTTASAPVVPCAPKLSRVTTARTTTPATAPGRYVL
jgi:hypothetical protein